MISVILISALVTSWEEPPTKAKRKKKGKETTYDKRENTDSNAVVLVQDSGGNHDSETR